MDMSESEIGLLARHLGHDVSTHKDFYKLSSHVVELSKVSQMLLAVERGMLHEFKGKRLCDIDIKDLPSIEEDDSGHPDAVVQNLESDVDDVEPDSDCDIEILPNETNDDDMTNNSGEAASDNNFQCTYPNSSKDKLSAAASGAKGKAAMACSKNDNISHVGGGVSDDSDDEIPAIVAKKTSKSVPVTSSAKQSASGAKGKAAVACSKIDNPSHVGGGVIFDSDDEIPTKVAKRISTSVPATSSAKQSASGGKGKAAVACSKSDNISHVGGGVSDDSDDEIPTKVAKKPTKSIRVAGSMKLSTSCAKVGSITGAVSTVKHCKRRWSSGDLDLLLKTFGKDITCKRMPPTAQLISFMSLLSEPRSLAQVRAHVHNYISGKISHF